jgi:phage terminase small subunit
MGALENARHEKFAQELVQGTSQRKAYRVAFPKSVKWKDETVDSKASNLAKNDKVLARVKELQEEISSKAIMTAQERLEFLSGIVKDINQEKIVIETETGKKEFEVPANLDKKMKAIDLMNKMQGEYVTKIEGSVSVKLEDLI